MDLSFLTHVTALASLAVVAGTQLLKWKYFPSSLANKYPVPANLILSTLAAVIAVTTDKIPTPVAWTDWLLLVVTIAGVAAVVYNQLFSKWNELRSTEGAN